MAKTWTWSVTGGSFAGKTHEWIQEVCRSAGLSGIEGGVRLFTGYTDGELQALGTRYRDAGVRIDSFHLPFEPEDDIASFYETTRRRAVEKARRWMERAALLGARVCIQHPSTSRYSVDDEGLDNYIRQLGRSLEELLPVADRLQITIAVENMMPGEGGRIASRPEHFERFARDYAHPKLGFCLDTGHALAAAGPERAGEFFAAMAPHLVAFHLADNAGDRDSHLAPGRGLVDWSRVFRRAAEIRFAHCMCIETPPFAPGPDYTPEAWRQLVAETETLAERALAE